MPLMLTLASDPQSHVMPHSFFPFAKDWNLNFGLDKIPLLNIPLWQGFYFTNHLLMTLVAAGLCLLVFFWLGSRYRSAAGGEPAAPKGVANLLEAMLQFVREGVARPVLGHRTDEYIGFLWTLFFFILFCNLLGMVPLDSIVYLVSGRTLQHVGGTATGNLAITGGLAICSFLMIHFAGAREVYRGLIRGSYGQHTHHGEHGEWDVHNHDVAIHAAPLDHVPHHKKMSPATAALVAFPLYVWNFAPHVFAPEPHAGPTTKLLMHLIDVPMWAFLLLLEFIGALIKPFALMIRLFANMVAGHIVLASILALIFAMGSYVVAGPAVLGSIALSCLELFVAFLQAYIFVFLTTLFIGMSVAPEH